METRVRSHDPPQSFPHTSFLEAAESGVMSGIRKQGDRVIVLEEGILTQETWVCQPSQGDDAQGGGALSRTFQGAPLGWLPILD